MHKLLAVLFVAAGLTGCRAPLEVPQVRELAAFDAVRVADGLGADVRVGNAQRVVVHGDPRRLASIGTRVVEGVLRISSDGLTGSLDGLHVDIEVPRLCLVSAEDGAQVLIHEAQGPLLMIAPLGAVNRADYACSTLDVEDVPT
jgi:hypothetical protein